MFFIVLYYLHYGLFAAGIICGLASVYPNVTRTGKADPTMENGDFLITLMFVSFVGVLLSGLYVYPVVETHARDVATIEEGEALVEVQSDKIDRIRELIQEAQYPDTGPVLRNEDSPFAEITRQLQQAQEERTQVRNKVIAAERSIDARSMSLFRGGVVDLVGKPE